MLQGAVLIDVLPLELRTRLHLADEMCNLCSFGSPGRVMDAANKALGSEVRLGAGAGNLAEGFVGGRQRRASDPGALRRL